MWLTPFLLTYSWFFVHYLVCHTRQVVQMSLPCWCIEFVLHRITPPTDVTTVLDSSGLLPNFFLQTATAARSYPQQSDGGCLSLLGASLHIFLNNQWQAFDSCFDELFFQVHLALYWPSSCYVFCYRESLCAQYVSRVSSSSSRSVVCDYRYEDEWCIVDNTQLDKRNAEMHNVPP